MLGFDDARGRPPGLRAQRRTLRRAELPPRDPAARSTRRGAGSRPRARARQPLPSSPPGCWRRRLRARAAERCAPPGQAALAPCCSRVRPCSPSSAAATSTSRAAWAGLVAWLLVVIAVAGCAGRCSRGSRARPVAVGGLVLLALWTLLSATWAPIAGSAYHRGQLVVLYAGGLLAARRCCAAARALRAVEPALAAGRARDRRLRRSPSGCSRACCTSQHSISAQGRLEQPLTYWNAMGEVAAIGLVSARGWPAMARDRRRIRLGGHRGCRAARDWAVPVVLPRSAVRLRGRPRHAGRCRPVARAAAQRSGGPGRRGARGRRRRAVLIGVTSLAGTLATRERQGAIVLALLRGHRWRGASGRSGRWSRRAPTAA